LEDLDADGRIILMWFREQLNAKGLKKGHIYGIVLKSIMKLTIE
jgi:hypothetical protein